jgi:hypothetical protein
MAVTNSVIKVKVTRSIFMNPSVTGDIITKSIERAIENSSYPYNVNHVIMVSRGKVMGRAKKREGEFIVTSSKRGMEKILPVGTKLSSVIPCYREGYFEGERIEWRKILPLSFLQENTQKAKEDEGVPCPPRCINAGEGCSSCSYREERAERAEEEDTCPAGAGEMCPKPICNQCEINTSEEPSIWKAIIEALREKRKEEEGMPSISEQIDSWINGNEKGIITMKEVHREEFAPHDDMDTQRMIHTMGEGFSVYQNTFGSWHGLTVYREGQKVNPPRRKEVYVSLSNSALPVEYHGREGYKRVLTITER